MLEAKPPGDDARDDELAAMDRAVMRATEDDEIVFVMGSTLGSGRQVMKRP